MWVLFYITFQNNNMSLSRNKEVYALWDGPAKMMEIIFGNTKTSTSVFLFCAVLYIFHTPKIYGKVFLLLRFIIHYLLISKEYKLSSQLNFEELLVSIHHFEKLFLFDLIIWLNKVGISKKSRFDGNKMMIRSVSSFIKAVGLHCSGAKKGYK